MITKKEITIGMEGLLSLESLVEVYEEMSAARMQKVRGAVVQSRTFLEGLLEVFYKVKEAYRKQAKKRVGWGRHNGRTVAVFVSANAGLYGDIVTRTFESFVEFVEKEKPEIVILGKLGLKMISDRLPNSLYNYYDFSDDGVEYESFEMIMRYLIQFEKIVVFYGKFKSILNQEPTTTSVSGNALEVVEQQIQRKDRLRVEYLFEPSADEIAQVFEGEILASLFEQTLHESQLAKFASRMLALDKAADNINRRLHEMKGLEGKLRHKVRNKKQLSTISGISLWG